MDSKALADTLTQILAPALPRLVGRVPNGARPRGNMERAEALWSRLGQKVEERPAAAEAAQDLAEAPSDSDAQAVFRRHLRKLLEGDAALAAEMASLVESVGTRSIYGSGGEPDDVVIGAGGKAIGREGSVAPFRVKSRD